MQDAINLRDKNVSDREACWEQRLREARESGASAAKAETLESKWQDIKEQISVTIAKQEQFLRMNVAANTQGTSSLLHGVALANALSGA